MATSSERPQVKAGQQTVRAHGAGTEAQTRRQRETAQQPVSTDGWKRRTIRSAVRAVTVAGVLAGAVALPSPASAASENPLPQLRACESGGDYTTNTGNGYYGAYQFDLPTWQGLGYRGLPSGASPAVQDLAVRQLYAQRGWQPWPVCGRGLQAPGAVTVRADRAYSPKTVTAAQPRTHNAPLAARPDQPRGVAHRQRRHGYAAASRYAYAAPVPFRGQLLSTALVTVYRNDVAIWQTQMVRRGWRLGIDGRYGRRSAKVAVAFQHEKGLRVDGLVGPQTWRAAWTAPVT